MLDRRRSEQWLLNALFGRGRDDQHLRDKCDPLCHNEMCATAHAVVAGAWSLMFMLTLRLRNVAVRIRKKVAGKHFHGCKEHEEDCGKAKRLGPKTHAFILPQVWLRRGISSLKRIGRTHAFSAAGYNSSQFDSRGRRNTARNLGISGFSNSAPDCRPLVETRCLHQGSLNARRWTCVSKVCSAGLSSMDTNDGCVISGDGRLERYQYHAATDAEIAVAATQVR